MDFINISVYNQASTSNYVRSTFAPHGDFDIFRRDDIEIEQLLAEQLLVEVNLTDIDNSVEEKLERIPPKSNYNPKDLILKRARENCYDPEKAIVDQYFKEFDSAQTSQKRVDVSSERKKEPIKISLSDSDELDDEECHPKPPTTQKANVPRPNKAMLKQLKEKRSQCF